MLLHFVRVVWYKLPSISELPTFCLTLVGIIQKTSRVLKHLYYHIFFKHEFVQSVSFGNLIIKQINHLYSSHCSSEISVQGENLVVPIQNPSSGWLKIWDLVEKDKNRPFSRAEVVKLKIPRKVVLLWLQFYYPFCQFSTWTPLQLVI